MKEYTITMTSKGQFTMPVDVRRAFGVTDKSRSLKLTYNPSTKQAKIEKPITFEEIRAMAKKMIDPSIQPLEDARAFYNTREPRV